LFKSPGIGVFIVGWHMNSVDDTIYSIAE